MGWQRDFIEDLRRTQFYSPNPLTARCNRAVQELAREIYQSEMHFVKEIIQNAEDNNYGKDVRPSLEFILTSDDVAEMCVPATLLVLNNEKGLTRSDVEALCDIKVSTKKGKRDKGYIGCKGIGFKSVFMVSKTPIIISNGFRICFSDEPSELGLGYIVPEWMDSPTNEAILAACGRGELPNTVLILPLRHKKVDLVREQLKGISPENILFLSKIKEVHVVDKMKNESGHTDSLKIIRSEPIVSFERQLPLRVSNVEVKVTAKMFKVNLRVERRSEVSGTFPYIVFQGLFPVTHRDTDREREEVSDWAISLAFPEVKRAPSHAGDVFSFLAMGLKTGFPFIVNADFLLTSSRDTIKFNEPWNIGILNCIPAAFEAALTRMILPSNRKFLSDRRDAYRFLPVNCVHGDTLYRYSSAGSSENRHVRQKLGHIEPEEASDVRLLRKVRDDILHRVGTQKWIFLSSPGIDNGLQLSKDYDLPAKSCLLIKSIFRNILKSSAQCNHPAPSAVLGRARTFSDGRSSSGSMFGIVDAYVQERYGPALEALGVSEMTMAQYKSFLLDSDWLRNLPDKIYIRVLSFVAFELKLLDEMHQDRVDLLKIRVTAGGQKLTSFARLDGTELLYTSSIENAEWIYAWIKEFSPWDSVEVLPAKTSQALVEASNSEELILWIRKRVTLTEMNVQKYAQRLIEKITGANAKNRNKKDSKFSVLVLQFLYSGIHDKKLSREFVVRSIENLRHVIVFDDKSSRERSAGMKFREEGGILLPAVVSKWPTLFSFCNSDTKHLIALSDRYLDPQCSLLENIVTKSEGPDSMLEFIKEAFNAVDLPLINLPAGELVTFRHPVTLLKSLSMLEWLKVFLPSRKAASKWENDRFLRSVKEFAWVKTYHHGWQLPTSVFFSIGFFQDHFTAHDLPFLDVPAYAHLNLTDDATQLVFEELSLVTDVRKENGCAAVVKYISTCSAKELDLEAVSRYYTYLDEVASLDQIRTVKIWIPAGATSEVPMWIDPAACIISDELGIFADSRSVTVLDKVYDGSLVPEFFNKLQVPEKASKALNCEIWLEWSCPGSVVSTSLDKVKNEDGRPQNASFVSRVKVEHVLKDILANWQDYSDVDDKADSRKDCSRTDTTEGSKNDFNSKDPSSTDPKVFNDDSSDDCSADSIEASGRADCSHDSEGEEEEDAKEEEDVEEEDVEEEEEEVVEEVGAEEEGEVSREVWESFHSRAWVPVAPVINELVKEANETISIMPPSQVLIADDLELSKSFSEVANGKLNFVWLPPSLSTEELENLNRMYLKMGARKLSQLITCEPCIPPDVLKTTVPRGKGLFSEGLFRSVLAYLCKNENKHGLSLEGRLGVLTPLISANEVVVGEPFEKNSRLSVETLTAPATIKKSVFVHYDRVERKLYCLRRNHALLKANVRKKVFNSQFVTTVSTGILYDHPELVQGLIDLLTLLWESKFSTQSLEREFKKQKLLIFPEDEKLLMESIAKFED